MFPIKMKYIKHNCIVDIYSIYYNQESKNWLALVWYSNTWNTVSLNELQPIDKNTLLCE